MKERIKRSFEKQGLMKTLKAELISVEAGEVKIACTFSENLTQQSGKTLTVCDGFVYDETATKLIAKMTATIMAIRS